MATRILVGTESGLWQLRGDALEPVAPLAGHSVTALARTAGRTWAILDGRTVGELADDGGWRDLASVEGTPATCLAPTPAGLLVGAEQAHLYRLDGGGLALVDSFETAEGRQTWYTPWGDPADVRSIAVGADGAVYVNVHVGGVLRSADGGRSWRPTLDIETDVHQVVAHPTRPEVVLVAAAAGFGVSRDGGQSWEFVNGGLHARYARAVAVSEPPGVVFISVSTGPGGRRAAVYRKPLDGTAAFERCAGGLPAWFGDNVDTACLAAGDGVVALGTEDGRLFRSPDLGQRWELVTKGLPAVRAVVIV
jgi:photosystem II stability/assembly factor-like uncharacterized protein